MASKPANRDRLQLMQERFPQYFLKKKSADGTTTYVTTTTTSALGTKAEGSSEGPPDTTCETKEQTSTPPISTSPTHKAKDSTNDTSNRMKDERSKDVEPPSGGGETNKTTTTPKTLLPTLFSPFAQGANRPKNPSPPTSVAMPFLSPSGESSPYSMGGNRRGVDTAESGGGGGGRSLGGGNDKPTSHPSPASATSSPIKLGTTARTAGVRTPPLPASPYRAKEGPAALSSLPAGGTTSTSGPLSLVGGPRGGAGGAGTRSAGVPPFLPPSLSGTGGSSAKSAAGGNALRPTPPFLVGPLGDSRERPFHAAGLSTSNAGAAKKESSPLDPPFSSPFTSASTSTTTRPTSKEGVVAPTPPSTTPTSSASTGMEGPAGGLSPKKPLSISAMSGGNARNFTFAKRKDSNSLQTSNGKRESFLLDPHSTSPRLTPHPSTTSSDATRPCSPAPPPPLTSSSLHNLSLNQLDVPFLQEGILEISSPDHSRSNSPSFCPSFSSTTLTRIMVEQDDDTLSRHDSDDNGQQLHPVSILVGGGGHPKGRLGKANMESPIWKRAASGKDGEKNPFEQALQEKGDEPEGTTTTGKEGKDDKKAGKEKNPFSHVVGSTEYANKKRKKAVGVPGSKGDDASPPASGAPATNPLTAALLQSMRRRPSGGGIGPGGRERKGSLGILTGTKDLLRQLNVTAASKATAEGGLLRKKIGGDASPEDSSGSSDNDSRDQSEEAEIPLKDTPAPYVASVGNVLVKHRERSSAVSFSDQFPETHSCSSHGGMDSITTEQGRSSFLSWSSSEPVFLPRVKLGKQRILRF